MRRDSEACREHDPRRVYVSPRVSPANYDQRRRVWNGMIDAKPAAIAMAWGVADVKAVIDLAQLHNVPVCVRGGGHSVSGLSCRDDVVVIDLCNLRTVSYDPSSKLVSVGGGATWKDVDRELTGHNRACVAGLISHTGVGGLCLSGGIGWLSRLHGLACDSLVGVELVTGTGQIITIEPQTEESAPDELLFGLRGAGANFGVVTKFVFQTHPVFCALVSMLIWNNPDHAQNRDFIMDRYESYCKDPALPLRASAYTWLTSACTIIVLFDVVESEYQFEKQREEHLQRVDAFSKSTNPSSDYPLSIFSMAEANSV